MKKVSYTYQIVSILCILSWFFVNYLATNRYLENDFALALARLIFFTTPIISFVLSLLLLKKSSVYVILTIISTGMITYLVIGFIRAINFR